MGRFQFHTDRNSHLHQERRWHLFLRHFQKFVGARVPQPAGKTRTTAGARLSTAHQRQFAVLSRCERFLRPLEVTASR